MAPQKIYREVGGPQLRIGSPTGTRWFGRGHNWNAGLLYPAMINPQPSSAGMASINAWGFKYTRMLLDMDNWTNSASLRNEIAQIITDFGNAGLHINLTLYSRGAGFYNGVFQNRALHTMPADGPAWWTSVVNAYKHHTHVVWGILNEPQAGTPGNTTDLTNWRNMLQPTVNAIRAAGSDHLIVANGMAWAKGPALQYVQNYQLNDPLAAGQVAPNIAYAFHVYAGTPAGWNVNVTAENTQAGWDTYIKPLALVAPVIAEEVGQFNGTEGQPGDGSFFNAILPWAESWLQGWMVWSNRDWSMRIADNSGNPAGNYGTALRDYMVANPAPDAGSSPSPAALAMTADVILSHTAITEGGTISGTATIRNTGGSSAGVPVAIGVRPAGVPRTSPPYTYDLQPKPSPTIVAGASYTIAASREALAGEAGGYYAFLTYQDPQTQQWAQPGADVPFTVGVAQAGAAALGASASLVGVGTITDAGGVDHNARADLGGAATVAAAALVAVAGQAVLTGEATLAAAATSSGTPRAGRAKAGGRGSGGRAKPGGR